MTRALGSRRAGLRLALLYLAATLPAAADLLLIRPMIIVPGDGHATSMNMLGGELIFRAGLVLETVACIMALPLAALLYRTFCPVHRTKARLLMLFILLGSATELAAASFGLLATTIISQPDYLIDFEPGQLEGLTMAVVTFQGHCLTLARLVLGTALLPLGLLVMASGTMPKIVGAALVAAAAVYLIVGLASVILPGAARSFFAWACYFQAAAQAAFLCCAGFFGTGPSTDASGAERRSHHADRTTT